MNHESTSAVATPIPWRQQTTFAILVAALLGVAYGWTFWWMGMRWEATDSYYSHGWLIPPVSIFFVWANRKRLTACPFVPSRWGLPVLGGGLFLHLVGLAWRVGFISGFSLLVVFAGLVLIFFGGVALRVLAFPIVFLVFMVPIPEATVQYVSFQSKMFAATVSAHLLDLVGVTVVRKGSYVLLEGDKTLVVDDICSGLKYMISLAAFGAMYAYISRLKWQGKTLIILLTAPVAVAANVVRVALMTLIANHWTPQAIDYVFFHLPLLGDVTPHTLLGLVLFVTAFMLFFLLESLLVLFLPQYEDAAEGNGGTIGPTAPTGKGGAA